MIVAAQGVVDMPPRLNAAAIARHLLCEDPPTRRIVRTLRKTILSAAPSAVEAIKFHVLCYYHADAWFGSIGGNICMIEVKQGRVLLTFIHGALLPDPAGILYGRGKSKRFVRIADCDAAASSPVADLVRASAELRPWD